MMKRWTRLAGAALLASTAWQAPAVADDTMPTAVLASSLTPGIGVGDFEFYVDVAGIRRAAEGRTVTRVLVQFPARSILDQTEADRADLRVRVLVYDGEEAVRRLREAAARAADDEASRRESAARADQQVHDVLASLRSLDPTLESETRTSISVESRADVSETDYRLAELALEVQPGDHVVEVVVENRSRFKPGMLDRVRKRHLEATSRMLVRVPDLQAAPSLADPVFRVGHNARQDYASRVYGLLNDSLHVSTTLYGEGEMRLDLVAHDRAGEAHWRDSLVVDVAGNLGLEFNTSVNTFPAGQYVLTLTATTSDVVLTSHRSFDVAWSLSSWRKSRRDLDLEAEIVLSGREFETYSSVPLGEKERFVDGFWANQDPTPDTAYNEVLQEFHRRVALADVKYSEMVRGALTDRGKVFIRFGAPEEVQSDALPSPLVAQALIEEVEDPFSTAIEEVHPLAPGGTISGSTAGGAAEAARLNRERERVIGRARELTAYELWTYAGNGKPLLERDVVVDSGFRVLFVDTQGFGEYRLRKSSVTFDIPGLHPSF
jgi:GWxTD domain-containing protein